MNQELLATHQIISLFEKSKSLADNLFDNLTGVFLNMDAQGKILRANIKLAEKMGLNHEDLLDTPFSRFFSPEDWAVFATRFREMITSAAPDVEFELPLMAKTEKSRDYIWHISAVELNNGPMSNPIYLCIGRDISEVKSAQAKAVSMAKDLELAEAVQNMLLPSQRDLSSEKLDMAAFYKSAAISGGDYWAFDFITKDKVWVLVGDVTGHGVGPAMVTALVSGCFSTLKFAAHSGAMKNDLPFVITCINKSLTQIPDQPYWMTLFGVEIDLINNSLTWWSAGASPVYLLAPDGGIKIISERSAPLGAGENTFATGVDEFGPGHRLVIVTDGVTELQSRKGTEFGGRALKNYLVKSRSLSALAARDALLEDLNQWREEAPQDDDITYVILDRK